MAPSEFGGSEKRTERETDNLLIIAPQNQNPYVVPIRSVVGNGVALFRRRDCNVEVQQITFSGLSR